MRRPKRAALVALPLLALVAGQGMVGAQTEGDPVRITASTRVTQEDLAPSRTYGAPFLAVDPENENVIVAATPEMRTRACRFMRSQDGGRTWRLMDAFPGPQSYPFCFHTSASSTTQTPIRFGRGGAVYYALNGWDNQDVGAAGDHPGTYANFSVLVAKSTNLGESWDPVLVRDARGKTGPGQAENNRPITGLAVDHRSGDQDIVYVGWNQSFPQATPAQPSNPMVAVSTDGGRTYGEPVKVVGDYWRTVANKPDPEKWGGSSPTLTVADDGTLYVVFYASATGQPTGSQVNSIMLAKSTDRGRTFTISEIAPPSGFYQATPDFDWSPEGGPEGTLHIAYEDKIAKPDLGDRDVFTRRSTDGGRTWSDAKQLNDDAVSATEGGHTQTNPALGIARNGRVDAVWWDFRNDNGLFINDVYYSYSDDNGATWSKNIRISDKSIDRRIGVWSNGYDMRFSPGIASTDKLAVVAWDDTRNGDQLTQTQDVYSGIVQHQAIGGGSSNALRFAIAGLIGLATVGLILLAVSLLSGRRGPQADAPVVQPEASKGRVGTS
ncbi:MAG TPA: sialidase family protein [Acidimicrobiales bacterium]|nr:sialidase family protein [Acidimicrobiales bacterium]